MDLYNILKINSHIISLIFLQALQCLWTVELHCFSIFCCFLVHFSLGVVSTVFFFSLPQWEVRTERLLPEPNSCSFELWIELDPSSHVSSRSVGVDPLKFIGSTLKSKIIIVPSWWWVNEIAYWKNSCYSKQNHAYLFFISVWDINHYAPHF